MVKLLKWVNTYIIFNLQHQEKIMSIKWITKRLAVSYFQDNKLTEADGKEIPITDLNKRRNGTLGFVCDPDFFLLGWTGISRLFSKNSGQFSSCSSSAITNHAANLNLYTVLPRSHRDRAERGNTLKTGFYLFYPNMAEFSLYGENHHEIGCLLLQKMAAC